MLSGEEGDRGLYILISFDSEALSMRVFYFILFYFIYLFILLFRAAPTAYESSQARGLIGAAAASLHQSHAGSEPHL